jgi:cell division protein FtsB
MSSLTYITFWALIAGTTIGASLLTWWILREVKRMDSRIDTHDIYINDTAHVFNKIQIELAVQQTSMNTLKSDISEIKEDVKTLLKR